MTAGAADVRFSVLVPDGGGDVELTALEEQYGGPLRFGAATRLVSNFVASVDGVASLGLADGTDSSTIAARSAADRLLMAMLRAACDTVLIGAQTLRTTPGHRWTGVALQPDRADDLRAYRAALGRDGAPALAVVSASGRLPDHPALRTPGSDVLVITTARGEAQARQAGTSARVAVVGEGGAISGHDIVDALARELGPRLTLSEGGPTLMGSLFEAGAVDELFLTLSPRLAGRAPGDRRPGMVAGWEAPPDALRALSLRSLRRSGDHLFLRYGVIR